MSWEMLVPASIKTFPIESSIQIELVFNNMLSFDNILKGGKKDVMILNLKNIRTSFHYAAYNKEFQSWS
jgi:hypothetical protein